MLRRGSPRRKRLRDGGQAVLVLSSQVKSSQVRVIQYNIYTINMSLYYTIYLHLFINFIAHDAP